MTFTDKINIKDILHREIQLLERVPEKVAEDLIKTDKIGEEMHLPLVNDCLIKEKAGTIKKVNLDIGLKKTNKNWRTVLPMREDRHAFEVILWKRSEPRRGVSIPCYTSAIKLGTSRFNS